MSSNPHPGEILRIDFLEPLGITTREMAGATGIEIQHLEAICQGSHRIGIVNAWVFAAYLGTTPQFWINLQAAYDAEVANHVPTYLKTWASRVQPHPRVQERLDALARQQEQEGEPSGAGGALPGEAVPQPVAGGTHQGDQGLDQQRQDRGGYDPERHSERQAAQRPQDHQSDL